jgi:hypothetical protein
MRLITLAICCAKSILGSSVFRSASILLEITVLLPPTRNSYIRNSILQLHRLHILYPQHFSFPHFKTLLRLENLLRIYDDRVPD